MTRGHCQTNCVIAKFASPKPHADYDTAHVEESFLESQPPNGGRCSMTFGSTVKTMAGSMLSVIMNENPGKTTN